MNYQNGINCQKVLYYTFSNHEYSSYFGKIITLAKSFRINSQYLFSYNVYFKASIYFHINGGIKT